MVNILKKNMKIVVKTLKMLKGGVYILPKKVIHPRSEKIAMNVRYLANER